VVWLARKDSFIVHAILALVDAVLTGCQRAPDGLIKRGEWVEFGNVERAFQHQSPHPRPRSRAGYGWSQEEAPTMGEIRYISGVVQAKRL
jgi:hypothetical protein